MGLWQLQIYNFRFADLDGKPTLQDFRETGVTFKLLGLGKPKLIFDTLGHWRLYNFRFAGPDGKPTLQDFRETGLTF